MKERVRRILLKKEELKNKERESKESECVHYWRIGPIQNGLSVGICKKCNEKKEFQNTSLESYSWRKKKDNTKNGK